MPGQAVIKRERTTGRSPPNWNAWVAAATDARNSHADGIRYFLGPLLSICPNLSPVAAAGVSCVAAAVVWCLGHHGVRWEEIQDNSHQAVCRSPSVEEFRGSDEGRYFLKAQSEHSCSGADLSWVNASSTNLVLKVRGLNVVISGSIIAWQKDRTTQSLWASADVSANCGRRKGSHRKPWR